MSDCDFCGGPVEGRIRFRKIEGWEETRGGGGANKIILRRTTGEVAHPTCVETRKAGRSVDQLGFGDSDRDVPPDHAERLARIESTHT